PPRVHLRELRPEEEDLRGPVDPDEENHQRSGGAVRRADGPFPEPEAEAELADHEEQRREAGAEPDIAPFDMRIRQVAKDHREENSDDGERYDELERLEEGLAAGEARADPVAHAADGGVDDERNEEQEADSEDHRHRAEALA